MTPSYMLFSLCLFIPFARGDDCDDAPTPSLRVICMQIHRWDTQSRETPAKKKVMAPAIPGSEAMAAEFSPIASNVYQCMDIACLCVFFRGMGGTNCMLGNKVPLRRALRKEVRMLTDDERSRLWKAFRTIKENGEYDRLARIHSQFSNSGAAHSGPAFLPWHREFTKRLEIALRQVDPTVSLAYWDSSLDNNLPDPKMSVMFSTELIGDSPGNWLTDGPFRNWRTIEGQPNVKREVGHQGKGFDAIEIDYLMDQTSIEQVLAFSAPKKNCPFRTDYNCLEYTHGNVHLFVGGDMVDTPTSANDPVFWFHHSFVDSLWEQWRQNKQNRYDRETVYPVDNVQCSSEHHFAQAFMAPFSPLKNVDGLSNMYTDNMFSYATRPSCKDGPNCGSKFLFCDRSHGQPRCASKIRAGGNCTGFTNKEDICYNSKCEGGKCVSGTAIQPTQISITPVKPVVPPSPDCFNENECCSVWSGQGECNRNPLYMNTWCRASCGVCRPVYDLNTECLDRHTNCATWSRSTECIKNPLWMSENCRQSCNKCGTTRAQTCGGSGGAQAPGTQTSTTISPPLQKPPIAIAARCTSPGCYNENQCCVVWASQGECRRNARWMECNCKVACQQCLPEYRIAECEDYHPQCVEWSAKGECLRNGWMLENCRRSCRNCASIQQLVYGCPRRTGRLALIFHRTPAM